MSKYLIMRVEKLKSKSSIKGMASHNFRAINTPNADSKLTNKNEHRASQSVSECMQKYDDLKPEKIRKNAVHALDYMITTSSDASEKDKEIAISEAIDWVTEKHGKENILMCSVHRDETTPHVHIVAMPLLDGKLNAKHFVGGSKHRMAELQDELHERVADKTELKRGIRGSRANHQTIKNWRAGLEKRLSEPLKTLSANDMRKQAIITRSDAISPQRANERVSGVIDKSLKNAKAQQTQNLLLLDENKKLRSANESLEQNALNDQKKIALQERQMEPIKRAAGGDIQAIDDIQSKLSVIRERAVKTAAEQQEQRLAELKQKIQMHTESQNAENRELGQEPSSQNRGEHRGYRQQRGRVYRGHRSARVASREDNQGACVRNTSDNQITRNHSPRAAL
jgi:hypothetical protein